MQFTLWPVDEPRRPIARRSDPETSKQAAEAITASGVRDSQLDMIARLVRAYPGRTSRELAQAAGIDRHIVARRLPEAEDRDDVERGTSRRCVVGKRAALTWWPKGKAR